ncbi:receptor-transporting protein 4 [Stegastes partitus]|uniref:Receptor transporter protein 4 n=1 Tax=Stegastes partitus TaxID=144197 RepID=A0A3B5B300_9TELE|nr:PREDICTED: receptor-transporting protein 4 [Stegastes partitus]
MSTDWVPSLWMETFDELLNDDELDYGDSWTLNFNYGLTDEVTVDERKRGWKVFSHCAFGKFQCPSCQNIWPSARIVVLFRYRLRSNRGTVLMRPFGQACRRCHNDEFELPGFSEDAVERALLRLFSKIRKNCYNEEDDSDGGSAGSRKKFTKPHEKSLCEGCQMGICCEDED